MQIRYRFNAHLSLKDTNTKEEINKIKKNNSFVVIIFPI